MKLLLVAVLGIGTACVINFAFAKHNGGGIEGRWNITSLPEGWARVPGTHVIVTASEVKVCLGEIPTTTLRYTLDEEKGTIDATRKVHGKTVVQLGTYRREGDTLTLSVAPEGKPRPASPDTTKGAEHWVLKRSGD